jgi:hypothetical protein
MSRPVNVQSAKIYKLTCKFYQCKEEFWSSRPDSMYCCANCRENDYAIRRKIKAGKYVKCRVCQANLMYWQIRDHIKKHQQELGVIRGS